jgi:hypothetical protein
MWKLVRAIVVDMVTPRVMRKATFGHVLPKETDVLRRLVMRSAAVSALGAIVYLFMRRCPVPVHRVPGLMAIRDHPRQGIDEWIAA